MVLKLLGWVFRFGDALLGGVVPIGGIRGNGPLFFLGSRWIFPGWVGPLVGPKCGASCPGDGVSGPMARGWGDIMEVPAARKARSARAQGKTAKPGGPRDGRNRG